MSNVSNSNGERVERSLHHCATRDRTRVSVEAVRVLAGHAAPAKNPSMAVDSPALRLRGARRGTQGQARVHVAGAACVDGVYIEVEPKDGTRSFEAAPAPCIPCTETRSRRGARDGRDSPAWKTAPKSEGASPHKGELGRPDLNTSPSGRVKGDTFPSARSFRRSRFPSVLQRKPRSPTSSERACLFRSYISK